MVHNDIGHPSHAQTHNNISRQRHSINQTQLKSDITIVNHKQNQVYPNKEENNVVENKTRIRAESRGESGRRRGRSKFGRRLERASRISSRCCTFKAFSSLSACFTSAIPPSDGAGPVLVPQLWMGWKRQPHWEQDWNQGQRVFWVFVLTLYNHFSLL